MAPTADTPPLSDTEAAEKPVTEQLKKASIAGLPQGPKARQENTGDVPIAEEQANENGSRGRLQRKRSFEEVEGEAVDQPTSESARHHTRKRSRDSTAEEHDLNNGRKVSGERPRAVAETGSATTEPNGESERPVTPEQAGEKRTEAAAEAMASPKTKRSRLHSTTAEDNGVIITAPSVPETVTEKTALADSTETDNSGTEAATSKLPLTSGFANTSAVSPFGALAGSKSPSTEPPQTTASAFTSSAFGSFAGSASSGFGAIGKSSGGFGAGGGFATGSKSSAPEKAKENDKPKEPKTSAFDGALGQKSVFAAAPSSSSSFGSGASGFGKLGGHLGSAFGGGVSSAKSPFGGAGGGGLSAFVSNSGKPVAPLGSTSKSAKPFGAPAADDDEEGDEPGEEDSTGVKIPPLSQDEDKQDERFYAQQLETGEEDEETEYSCRAKVYNYTALEDGKKEWRERGLGVLRLNVNRVGAGGGGVGGGEAPVKARFLMRADGSHRVVLNTPLKKEITFGAASGGVPQGGLMLFLGTIDGKSGLEMLQLKMRQQYAVELYEKIVRLQQEM